MSVTNSDPGFKPGVPARPRISPADHGPSVLEFTSVVPARLVGPIHAFTRLVDALRERNQAEADEARKELRRRGFNVVPLGSPPKRGGRA